MKSLTNNQGSAILTALFIMILVAIAATAMSLRLQIDISRTQLIEDMTALNSAISYGQNAVINKLMTDGLKAKKSKDDAIDPPQWAFETRLTNNIQLKSELIDLQGRFNLNNIIDANQLKRFALLLSNIDPKLDKKKAFLLALFAKEWISPAIDGARNITTEQFYHSQKPPYQPSHSPFISVSELRLVKGFNHARFIKLLPFLTALPQKTAININTASKTIIQTLGAGLTEEQSEAFIKYRKDNKLLNLKKVLAEPEVKKLNLTAADVTLRSEYFLIVSSASQQQKHLVLFTKVKRTINKKGVTLDILQQAFNTL